MAAFHLDEPVTKALVLCLLAHWDGVLGHINGTEALSKKVWFGVGVMVKVHTTQIDGSILAEDFCCMSYTPHVFCFSTLWALK